MTGGEVAVLITAITGGVAGIFAAVKALSGTKIEGVNAVVGSYKSLVDDLQLEVGRLRTIVAGLEEENTRLKKRVKRLEQANGIDS